MSVYSDKQTKKKPNERTFDLINEIPYPKRSREKSFLNNKKINSTQKYFITTIFFTIGLVLVSIVKNETRELQAEINELLVKKNNLELELYRANLDHEVINSPQNISKLANEYLEKIFKTYSKSQIKNLNTKLAFTKNSFEMNENKNKIKKLITPEVAKKIFIKKKEFKKQLSESKKLTSELKLKIVKKKDVAKVELKKLYKDPKGTIKSKRTQNWAIFQVAKIFLGVPSLPGK